MPSGSSAFNANCFRYTSRTVDSGEHNRNDRDFHLGLKRPRGHLLAS
jgi:hypothetical protein